ncbi:MAG: DUF4150 domain-containing protein [Desulfovibrio sp.]|jgi:hypothetical protein|nr:DUF4150 domain-containing protein [Desulfovibrio sp.]
MFMLSMGAGMDMAFPDVCLTPVGPAVAPVPYPNTAMSAATAPVAANVLTECTPTLNALSKGLVSLGDQPGVLLGMASHMEAGQTAYNVGCFTIMVGGAPAQRLTSVTGQNCLGVIPNAVGTCIVPSQATVLSLG